MKIEVDDNAVRNLYYLNILKHANEEHKTHHVQLLDISEDLCSFGCIDCEIIFKAKLVT